MKPKKLLTFAGLAVTALASVQLANAQLVLNGGWQSNLLSVANSPTDESPYVFTTTETTQFSVTDAFVVGDTFSVFDNGSLLFTTSVGAGVPFAPSDFTADDAWESGNYSIGSIILAPGDYQISIVGDGAAGVPAGLYVRLDSAEEVSEIPEPGSSLALLGLFAAGFLTRRRNR